VSQSKPARAPQSPSASHGVSLPIAASEDQIHSREKLPRLPLRSVLRVSHPLDGLRPGLPCGFISPRSHVRDSPFRGFPSQAAVPTFPWAVPSCRCPASPTDPKTGASSTNPDFRACRHPGIRCRPAQVLPRTSARSPLGLDLPRVLPPHTMVTASRHLLPRASIRVPSS